MFIYDDNSKDIYYVKGDTAYFKVEFSPFKLEDGDVLNFTVKKRYGAPALISLTADESGMFTLNASDYDSELEPGEYIYDVQLTTNMDEIFTVIGPARFTMDIEVTTPTEG